jgi:murein L,D-transpeptidase YcbB/YkuD
MFRAIFTTTRLSTIKRVGVNYHDIKYLVHLSMKQSVRTREVSCVRAAILIVALHLAHLCEKIAKKWYFLSICYGTTKYFINKINALQTAFAQFLNVVPCGQLHEATN